ncbi:MAG: protein-tyrosine-phosphatase [Bacteroidetes bacterium]|jgi:protein-tyrosine-phosphatase|nr:protein-tyrosine-phosphatase [Bacteroidota bacterium]
MNQHHFTERLTKIIKKFESEFELISNERKLLLQQVSQYLVNKKQYKLPVKIIVICTHNSRRSHIGQLWLKMASMWYEYEDFDTYSGGTEATAFNYRSVAALNRVGLKITQKTSGSNPIYVWDYDSKNELFSKKYDEDPNPKKDFAAIMVCNEADEGCPFIPGADARFSLPFEDPKRFDNTELESEKYDERVHHIGRECFYILYYANELLILNSKL